MNKKQEELIECPYCGKKYSKHGIKSHIWRVHTEKGKKLNPHKNYIKGSRKAWNKGLTKETDERVAKYGKTYKNNYKNGKIKMWPTGLTKENDKRILKLSKKVSVSMKKAHKEGRAYNIGYNKHRREQSYPEKFFEKVINNDFDDKNYVCEYQFGIYSIDFAWPHKKLAIEMDGSQHRRFKNQMESDKKKDKLLMDNGWQVLRIDWIVMCHSMQKYIKIAKDFIDNENIYSAETSKQMYVEYLNELKFKTRKKYLLKLFRKIGKQKIGHIKTRKKYLLKLFRKIGKERLIETRIKAIINSDIDYTKYGWISKLSVLLKVSHTEVRRFINRHYDKINISFYKRQNFIPR